MNALTPLAAAPIDLLIEAVEIVRPQLKRSKPLKERAKIFWSAVAAAADNNLAAVDLLRAEFLQLAKDSGLAADLKHADLAHSDETLEHLLRWGLLQRNPFR
jgi:hypothetical protein